MRNSRFTRVARQYLRTKITGAVVCVLAIMLASCSSSSQASSSGKPPRFITVGTLYASVGQFSGSSLAQFAGLHFWVNTVNAQGGVYVKAYHKKIRVKIVAYDDQSQTSLASQEYTKLITQDRVNVAISDFGSVLTSVGVPVAQENGALLFDPTATTPSFFTESIFGNGNPDLVLTSLPSSAIWPMPLAQLLISKGIKKVAIIQSANDFDAAQATTVENILSSAGIVPVFNKTIQTTDTSFSSIIPLIQGANPDAVLEFGYASQDAAFLAALASSNYHPKFAFTVFPGGDVTSFAKAVPQSGLAWSYTYVEPPYLVENQVNYGMTTNQFISAFQAENPGADVNLATVAGYQVGLIVQATLQNSPSLSPISMRITAQKLSGHIQTLEGTFAISANGSQVGLYQPIGQFVPNGQGGVTLQTVYPPKYASASSVYPAPNSTQSSAG